jgi:hypothetical protein
LTRPSHILILRKSRTDGQPEEKLAGSCLHHLWRKTQNPY